MDNININNLTLKDEDQTNQNILNAELRWKHYNIDSYNNDVKEKERELYLKTIKEYSNEKKKLPIF